MARRSRLETREPKWWAVADAFGKRHGLSEVECDELFELILDAINEDAATMMGVSGGLKGGRARALRMTSAQRSASAKKAALARWKK